MNEVMREKMKFVRNFESVLEFNLRYSDIEYTRFNVDFDKEADVNKNKIEHIRYVDSEGVMITDFFVTKISLALYINCDTTTKLDDDATSSYVMNEYHFDTVHDMEYYGDDLPDDNVIDASTSPQDIKNIVEDAMVRYYIRKGVKHENNNLFKTSELVESVLESASSIMEENGSKGKATVIFVQPYGDKRSESYIKSKQKVLKKVGVNSITIKLSDNTNTKDMRELVDFLNELRVPSLIQLPLPNIDENVVKLLDASIDIDRFSYGCGKYNDEHCEELFPCTPNGILEIIIDYFENTRNTRLDMNEYMFSGKVITIIGRGKLVGDPLTKILRDFGATVVSINSRTPRDIMLKAIDISDVIVSATGKHGVINQHMFNNMRDKHKLIVDAGVSFINGKLHGDFKVDPDYMWIYPFLKYTPCIGGVGPMTVACVAWNTAILMNNLDVVEEEEIKNKIKERGYDYE